MLDPRVITIANVDDFIAQALRDVQKGDTIPSVGADKIFDAILRLPEDKQDEHRSRLLWFYQGHILRGNIPAWSAVQRMTTRAHSLSETQKPKIIDFILDLCEYAVHIGKMSIHDVMNFAPDAIRILATQDREKPVLRVLDMCKEGLESGKTDKEEAERRMRYLVAWLLPSEHRQTAQAHISAPEPRAP